MTTKFTKEADQLVMFFEGRLDTAAAPQTEKEMQPLYDSTGQDIVLDCTKLEYISSSGLRILMHIAQQGWINHCEIFVHGLQPNVYDVFKTTGFVHLFKFKD